MSRCFPYLPPGCQTESIKLRRESVETEKRKGRKREKKERRKHGERSCVGAKFRQEDKRLFSKERGEKSEKSDLTEEDKQPLSSQSLCYLSDGGKTHGTIIRIQLPLRRNRESDMSVNGVGLCSTLGIADCFALENEIIETSLGSILYDGETRTAESLHQDLIVNLEDSFHFELNNPDDQEWLFGKTKQEHGCKRLKVYHDVSCHAESMRALYLPEADVYGLPYTIPF